MQSRFDSRCQACGERIYEGDEIAKDEDLDAWVHEDCVDNIMPKRSTPARKKTGPSLADKLEGFEPASVASPALSHPGFKLRAQTPFEAKMSVYVGCIGRGAQGPFDYVEEKQKSYELRHRLTNTQLYLPFSVIKEMRAQEGVTVFVVSGDWVGFEKLQEATRRDAQALESVQGILDGLFGEAKR